MGIFDVRSEPLSFGPYQWMWPRLSGHAISSIVELGRINMKGWDISPRASVTVADNSEAYNIFM